MELRETPSAIWAVKTYPRKAFSSGFFRGKITGIYEFGFFSAIPGFFRYRLAILVRPAWPYAWADFTMAKARARQIDDEFFAALERATTLGPWERRVMDTVTQLGLWYEPWLPEDVARAVQWNVVRYAKAFPRQAMATARAQQKVDKVCPLLDRPERFRRDCGAG